MAHFVDDFRHRRGVSESACYARLVKGEHVHVLAFDVDAPYTLHVVHGISLCVDNRRLILQRLDLQIFGINFKRRTHRDIDVTVVNGLSVKDKLFAFFVIPCDFVKYTAAGFRPSVRLLQKRGKTIFFHYALQDCGCEFRALNVALVACFRTDRHARFDARQFCKSGFDDRRDMVVNFPFLPVILPAVVVDVARRRDACVLISHKKVHVKPPGKFDGTAFLTSLFKILFDFFHDLVVKRFFVFFFHSHPFLSIFANSVRSLRFSFSSSSSDRVSRTSISRTLLIAAVSGG